jgi:hypothetical protein
MHRNSVGSEFYLQVYHTQESRVKRIAGPIICTRDNAWLGVGYYFWIDEEFAHNWGISSKNKTGRYDIYLAEISEDKILNATFNEEEYDFFVRSIEKARKHLAKSFENITLKSVHRFLADKIWSKIGIKGIIFDDIPHNALDGSRIYSDIKPLYYKKRIQIVIFDRENIVTFAPHILNVKCN